MTTVFCKGKSMCAMKANGRVGGIAPFILNLDDRCECVLSLMPWQFYPQGKSLPCPLKRRLGGLQSLSRCFGREVSLSLTGNRTLISVVKINTFIMTELVGSRSNASNLYERYIFRMSILTSFLWFPVVHPGKCPDSTLQFIQLFDVL